MTRPRTVMDAQEGTMTPEEKLLNALAPHLDKMTDEQVERATATTEQTLDAAVIARLFPTGRLCVRCGLGEKYPLGCFCGAQDWMAVAP